jgi:hypothetical protein
VTYRLKAKSSEREETAVARQRLFKYFSGTTDTHATIGELSEAMFFMQSVPTAYKGTSDILVLKLWCNKRSIFTERPTPPFVEEEAPFPKHVHTLERKYLGQKSRQDLKPRMTVLTRPSSNVTDRPSQSAVCNEGTRLA